MKFGFAYGFHTLHHLNEPTPRFYSFIPQKKRLVPFCQHRFFWFELTFTDDENLARCRNPIQQNVGSDPARTSSSWRERLPLLDNVSHEEMFWNNGQVD